MFRIFNLVIRTKKEEEAIIDEVANLRDSSIEVGRMLEALDNDISLAGLRKDIMSMDILPSIDGYNENNYVLNEVLDLIDKWFGPEKNKKTPEIKFGRF